VAATSNFLFFWKTSQQLSALPTRRAWTPRQYKYRTGAAHTPPPIVQFELHSEAQEATRPIPR